METEDFSNKFIRNEILYWETEQPSLKEYFQSESMSGLLEIIDTATYAIKDPKLITDFVLGCVALKFLEEAENDIERQYFKQQSYNLMLPLTTVLKKHIESDYRDYIIDQEVTGEEIIKTDRVIVPITKNALKRHINKTKVFPMNTTDIEKLILDFIDYKEQFYSKLTISKDNNNGSKEEKDKKPHNYPKLSSKYDPKKVYDLFFTGEIALCNYDCFKDWFVDGYEAKKIKPTLKGRISSKTRKEAIAFGQIRKFIETITETEGIGDTYFVKVFGFPKDSNTGKNLDQVHIDNLERCKKE